MNLDAIEWIPEQNTPTLIRTEFKEQTNVSLQESRSFNIVASCKTFN